MTKDNERNKYDPVGEYVSIYKRGKNWWVNYQNLEGKQKRKTLSTASKKQARKKALKKEAELQQGYDSDDVRIATIDEAITAYDDYLVAEDRARKTMLKYRLVFARVEQLAEDRGVKDMRGVSLTFVDSYRKQRKNAGAAPKTIHNESTVVKQLVNFCLRRDLLDKDRLKDFKLKRPKATPQPCWTSSEVGQILKSTTSTPYHELYGILAWTGMRIGEAKFLAWDDIDFQNRVLHIREKVVESKPREIWKPKDGDQRVIPLSTAAIAVLKTLPRRGRWVFVAPVTARNPKGDRQINDRHVLSTLKTKLKDLGLPGHTHTFRHSLISHALISGVPEAVVREWAGHVDSEILKLYTHIGNAESKAFMDGLFMDDSSEDEDTKGGSTNTTPDEGTASDDADPSEEERDNESDSATD